MNGAGDFTARAIAPRTSLLCSRLPSRDCHRRNKLALIPSWRQNSGTDSPLPDWRENNFRHPAGPAPNTLVLFHCLPPVV
jgi:hypothetical protein